MKKLLFLLVLGAFFVPSKLFSQAKVNVDSLLTVLEQYPKADTVKVKVLLGLAGEYKKSDTQKAMEYAEAAIKISEQLQNDFWSGKAYNSQSGILTATGDLKEAQAYCQKAISFFEKGNKYPNELANCMMLSGTIGIRSGDYPAALERYEAALAIFEKTKNVKGQLKVLTGIATANLNLGNQEKALESYKKGIEKSIAINDNEILQLNYTNIAIVYYYMGDYILCLDYQLKSVAIAELLGNLQALATEYNNIASIYFDLNDKEESHKYLFKALNIYRKINDKIGIARTMVNITLSYDDHLKAIEELKKAVEYCEATNNRLYLCAAHQNLAFRHYNLKAYSTAYFHAQKGLEIDQEINNVHNRNTLNNNLAEILIDCDDKDLRSLGIEPSNRYEKAKEYLDKVFLLTGDENSRYTMFAWLNLSTIQEKQQNYVQAYESYKKYVAIKDSLSGDDAKKQVTRKEIQYEFDKKETALKYQQQLTAGELEKQRLLTVQQKQALALNRQTLTLKEQALALSNKEKDLSHLAYLKEQAEKQEKTQELSLSQEREKGKERDLSLKNLELSAQQQRNYYLTAFAALLILGLGALSYFYATLKKQKNTIAQQNEINEHTIAILSHDIKAPLIGVKLLLKKLNKDDPYVAQASQSLEDQINAVNGILNNLLRMKKLALGQKDKKTSAQVNTVLQNVLQELNTAIQAKGLAVQNDLKDDVNLPIAPEKLQIILHNLLSNAVKYSFSHKPIRIFKEGKGIAIQDFGVGLSPEQRSKLMREVTASQAGTQQERGNGLGLFLVGAMLQGEAIHVAFDSPDIGGTIVRVLERM